MDVKKKSPMGFVDTVSKEIRKRKFVPFGLYCDSCNTLIPDEYYMALEPEERKIKPSLKGEVIVQGYDNLGFCSKRYARLQ